MTQGLHQRVQEYVVQGAVHTNTHLDTGNIIIFMILGCVVVATGGREAAGAASGRKPVGHVSPRHM